MSHTRQLENLRTTEWNRACRCCRAILWTRYRRWNELFMKRTGIFLGPGVGTGMSFANLRNMPMQSFQGSAAFAEANPESKEALYVASLTEEAAQSSLRNADKSEMIDKYFIEDFLDGRRPLHTFCGHMKKGLCKRLEPASVHKTLALNPKPSKPLP